MTISLIPAIGAALARGDRSAAGRHTVAAFRLTALLALPAGVGLSVLARPSCCTPPRGRPPWRPRRITWKFWASAAFLCA